MSTRRRGRQIVLQLLYQDDLRPTRPTEGDRAFIHRRLLGNAGLAKFAEGLLEGVRSHRDALDEAIGEHTINWSIKRMSIIDRNILRLAGYELLMTDAPHQVVINEAIELAKRFGQQNSGVFVNGILDRVAKRRTRPAANSAGAT